MFSSIFGINNRIDERLAALSGKVSTMKKVSDVEAEKLIESYLIEARAQGTTEVSTLEVMANTGVPSSQVSHILQKLVQEDRLQEA